MHRWVLVASAMVLIASAAAFGQQETETGGEIALSATPEQLGWMAYGAPIKTFEAMGCEEQARSAEEMFALADSLETMGNILGLATLASIGTEILSFTVKIGPVTIRAQAGAFLASLGLSLVSDFVRVRERQRARELATQIAELHLRGEETCFRPAE